MEAPVTSTNNASTPGGDDDSDDFVEPDVGGSGEGTDGDSGGDGFVVGAGLDSEEKQKIMVGAIVIGSVAAALVVAAYGAKRYNARISALEEDDEEDHGLTKGRPGRLQAKNQLPRYRISPEGSRRTMDI